MKTPLDRSSPVPLYHQLAEGLRWRISTGELEPGSRLPSLRAAAKELGVNLHTVRAAYEALVQEGLLLSAGRHGTRVIARPPSPSTSTQEVAQWVSQVLAEARRRFGLSPAELVRRVEELGGETSASTVSVVECSLAQCRDHAEELSRRLSVTAEPWPLDREGEPPPGTVVATYFHYGEVVRRWPHRKGDLVFVAVRPDAQLAEELERRFPRTRRVAACELDEVRAANLAADLEAALGGSRWTIEPLPSPQPGDAVASRVGVPVCFSPRAWSALDPAACASPRALRARYVIDSESLDELARQLSASASSGSVRFPD